MNCYPTFRSSYRWVQMMVPGFLNYAELNDHVLSSRRWRQYVTSKHWNGTLILHGV